MFEIVFVARYVNVKVKTISEIMHILKPENILNLSDCVKFLFMNFLFTNLNFIYNVLKNPCIVRVMIPNKP
jgi:hypothetical protein